jgi:hypothetical protein
MAAPVYACLTCDLLGSREQPDRGKLQRRLEKELQQVNAERAADLVVPFSITLGDEWQGLARSAPAAFELDFRLRRGLWPLRLRSGVGVGAMTSDLRERTALMDGPCFHRSRAALDLAKKRRGPITVLDSGQPELDAFVSANELLLHAVMDDWTERQFECVMTFIDLGSEPAAAKALRIAQPTLHKSVASALGKEIMALMEARNRYLASVLGPRK